MNRRKFLKSAFWGFTGIGLFSGFYAWQIEPFWLEFVKVKMPIKNLPSDLIGKTLMQISDIHIGNRFDYHFVINSFKKAKEFNPDFVVYTGDYVSSYKDEVQYHKLEETLNNVVKGKIATIGILGNFSGGSITEGGPANGFAPHPVYTDADGVEFVQLNAITLGGFNGLNS